MRKANVIVPLLIATLLILGGCASTSEPKAFPPPEGYSSWEEYNQATGQTPATTISPEAEAPRVTELGKSTAIDQIKAYPEVLDAAITQDSLDLSLAIIVLSDTSEARAEELGDAFVRLVKTFGLLDSDKSEPAPGEEIGEGIFNYLITVAYPDQTIIVQGAKVSFATHITW